MIRTFNRYEIKYVLTVSQMFAVIEDLKQFMESDPYALARGGYVISSLYYDSHDYECYRNKVDGIKFRRKLRIRRYENTGSDRVFVEIKQRINRTVQKRRVPLTLAEASTVCSGNPLVGERQEDNALISEIRYLHHCLKLRRACIIKYHRRAFQGGRYERGLRVTFDTNLRYRVHSLDFDSSAQNRFFLPPDTCILEVKTNDRIPTWLTLLLARHQCELSRVSKYVLGLRRGFENFGNRRTIAAARPRE